MKSKEVKAAMKEIKDLERGLMKDWKKLAKMKRKLPPTEFEDMTLTGTDGKPVSLSALFGDHDDLIVIQNMGEHCAYCTMWADGINGLAKHLENRAALVLVSPDHWETVKRFSSSRGWTYRCVSAEGTEFKKACGFSTEDGKVLPGMTTFSKTKGGIVRVANASFGPWDAFCPTWHMMGLLADGINDWEPKFKY